MSKVPSSLTGLPKRRTMRRTEAEAFLGGRQVVDDAVKAGVLKACCAASRKQTYFPTAAVVAVESDILEGRYPGKERA